MNERELIKLKEKIDQAKAKVSELKGKQDYLLQQLKEQWGCSTLEEAKGKAVRISDELFRLEEQIKSGIAELERKIT